MTKIKDLTITFLPLAAFIYLFFVVPEIFAFTAFIFMLILFLIILKRGAVTKPLWGMIITILLALSGVTAMLAIATYW